MLTPVGKYSYII